MRFVQKGSCFLRIGEISGYFHHIVPCPMEKRDGHLLTPETVCVGILKIRRGLKVWIDIDTITTP